MAEQFKILIIDDEYDFLEVSLYMLRRAGIGGLVKTAGSIEEGLAAIGAGDVELVLLDLGLPDSRGGVDSVKRICGSFPLLPVVVMTASSDEELGIEALKYGAQDYLVKNHFDWRELGWTMRYAAERKTLMNDKEGLIVELKEALARVKQLTGLLPICADCKKIRTEKGNWVQLESYISAHSEALFSHGFCDACYEKRRREMDGG